MSKHTDKYPEFDGSGDWKTWTGKIRPKLFKKKSQAYPDKTLFHQRAAGALGKGS